MKENNYLGIVSKVAKWSSNKDFKIGFEHSKIGVYYYIKSNNLDIHFTVLEDENTVLDVFKNNLLEESTNANLDEILIKIDNILLENGRNNNNK